MNSLVLVIIFGTLACAAPLIAAAYGGLFSERSGVVNIGLEGIMTIGAFAGATFVSISEQNFIGGYYVIVLGLLVAIIFGTLFALLHAFLSVTLKVDQIISGTVINIITLALGLFLTKSIFGSGQTPTFFLNHPIRFFDNKLTLITIVIILLSIVCYLVLYKTKWGMRVLAVGENPSSADAMGINVNKVRYQAVLLSGVFASIGGYAIVLNTTSNFSSATVAGSGFIALAVLIFGRHHPFGIIISGITFGFFKNLGIVIRVIDPDQMPNLLRFLTDIPDVIYFTLPYVLTIIVLIIFSRNKVMEMEALGKPYDKNER